MTKMQYNVCETCGAKDGRAGNLWGKIRNGVELKECENCHITRKSGEIFINANLSRTQDELKKTMDIVSA
jgi:Zn-finger protein